MLTVETHNSIDGFAACTLEAVIWISLLRGKNNTEDKAQTKLTRMRECFLPHSAIPVESTEHLISRISPSKVLTGSRHAWPKVEYRVNGSNGLLECGKNTLQQHVKKARYPFLAAPRFRAQPAGEIAGQGNSEQFQRYLAAIASNSTSSRKASAFGVQEWNSPLQVAYKDVQSAVDAVESGRAYGVLQLGQDFSASLERRLTAGFRIDKTLADDSTINARLDMSSKAAGASHIARSLTNRAYCLQTNKYSSQPRCT